MKEVIIEDLLRSSTKEITVRYDSEDIVTLPCHCKYDPALSTDEGNEVMLLRKIEVKNEKGVWVPYPSVTWINGEAGNEELLVTKAIIKMTEDGGICTMMSSQGVPDAKLMLAAEKAGICTETLN